MAGEVRARKRSRQSGLGIRLHMAQALVIGLKQAGNDLSRENIMKAATNLPDTTTLPMVLPGIKISSSPTDYRPMKSMRLVQFDGKMYKLVPE